ncbi:MAG: hypothetical protein AVDCRST_MAG69-487, partial [uncultured Solirubrobacteraceae bacterium]
LRLMGERGEVGRESLVDLAETALVVRDALRAFIRHETRC